MLRIRRPSSTRSTGRHLVGAVIALLVLTGPPEAAVGHGGDPTIIRIDFPVARPGEVWAFTDNQGLYAVTEDGTAWLCEDGVRAGAPLIDIATVDPTGDRWLVLTGEGLFGSDDSGCTVREGPPDLAEQTVRALSAHPIRPSEVVAVTETFGEANDAWVSVDGGGTWRAAGLAQRGRFTQLLRSEGDPDRLYAMHDRGGWTSDDGGHTWAPFAIGPPELEAQPFAFRLLAAPRGGPTRLFAAVEALPDTLVLASDDAGATWRVVTAVADVELRLVFDRAGVDALLISGFDGARRTGDGGETWVVEPLPVDRLQRIARAPDSDRLWGSTGLFFGGPWALARSDDLGRTWAPVLPRFEDVDRRWPCAEGAPSRACCQTLCPGRPVGAECPDQLPGPEGACEIELAPPLGSLPGLGPDAGLDEGVIDAGPDDVGLDASLDIGPDPGDAAVALDRATDGALRLDEGGPSVVMDGAMTDGPSLDADLMDRFVEPLDAGRPTMDGERPDASPGGRDADLRGDLLIAPDVQVIPPYPPESGGCSAVRSPSAPGSTNPSAWLGFLVVLGAALGRRLRVRGSGPPDGSV